MPKAPLQYAATPGIDIGKNSFHLIGLDARGVIVLRQKLSRGQVEQRLANMPSCLIGMEACVGAHHLSRQLLALGHDVKLIPAQFVKPLRDAEAIAEAVLRPTMRVVPTKTVEQLDLQALHRVRSRLASQRTAVINQIRTFLLERGIAVRQGLRSLRQALPGIVPRQNSTGDRTVLGRLSKRGNSYLRSLLIQAAKVLLLWPAKWRQHGFGEWLAAASMRLHHNVLAAALANKLACIAWSVLSQNRVYEPRAAAVAG